GRRAFGHGSSGVPAARKILRAAIDMSGSSAHCSPCHRHRQRILYRQCTYGATRLRSNARREHDKQGGSMISRRRFTAAAAATIAAGPFVRRAGAQTKTIVRYGDVLPANYPSVVAQEAAGKEVAPTNGRRLERQLCR